MKKQNQKGVSLLEGILVLSIGVAIGVSAFMIHNNRMRAIEVDTTYGQITKVVGSMNKIAGVLGDYTLLSESNALRKILPETMFDEEGKIQTSFGQVLISPFTSTTLNDSFSVTYENIPKSICVPVVSKSFDMFAKVYIAGQLVYDRAVNNELDMARVGTLCETSGTISVGFISERIPPKTGTGIPLSALLNGGNRLNPNALSTAGANLDALGGIFGTAAADAETGANTPDAVYRLVNLNGTAGTTFLGGGVSTGTYVNPGTATCGSANANWGNGSTSGSCGNVLPGGINSGSVEQITNTTPGFEGLAAYSCNNGLWTPFNAPQNLCYQGGCKGGLTLTWGGGCQGVTSLSASETTITMGNNRVNYDGSAPFLCQEGQWLEQAGASCVMTPACGSSNGQTFMGTDAPSNYCAVGTMVNLNESSTGWTWECQGAGVPTNPPNAACSAQKGCPATINIDTVQRQNYVDSYDRSASCWGYDVPQGSQGQTVTSTARLRGIWFTTTGNAYPSSVTCGTTNVTSGIVSEGPAPESKQYMCNSSGNWVTAFGEEPGDVFFYTLARLQNYSSGPDRWWSSYFKITKSQLDARNASPSYPDSSIYYDGYYGLAIGSPNRNLAYTSSGANIQIARIGDEITGTVVYSNLSTLYPSTAFPYAPSSCRVASVTYRFTDSSGGNYTATIPGMWCRP